MTAVLVMGKRQGTKRENLHLHGRVALAAAVWHSLGDHRLPVLHLAADVHGPARTRDGAVVRALLTGPYRVPPQVVHVRPWSRCTLVEVRAVRVLARARRLARVLAVTHGYHARRAEAYFAEAAVRVEMLPTDLETLRRFPLPAAVADLGPEIEAAVARARPAPLDLARERAVEIVLTALHALDRRGRAERLLTSLLRD